MNWNKSDSEIIFNYWQNLVESSGKMILFDKMLNELIKNDHKIIVLSQFSQMLDILEEFLYWKYKIFKSIRYLRVDPETPLDKVTEYENYFNNEESQYKIFLLSTRWSGLGLNLIKADTVIIFDSDFKQKNDLSVLNESKAIWEGDNMLIYRFITHNSVEQMLYEIVNLNFKNENLSDFNSENNLKTVNEILKLGISKVLNKTNGKINYTEDYINELMDRKNILEKLKQSNSEIQAQNILRLVCLYYNIVCSVILKILKRIKKKI